MVDGMRILHLVSGLERASGVTTFVEGLSTEFNENGVQSCVSTELPDTAEDCAIPDIVHLHGLWSPFYHKAVVWAKMVGVPIVWSTHGMLAPWSMNHKWWKKIPAWFLYQKRDLNAATLMHATVENEERWIRNLGFKQPIVIAPLGTHLPEMDAVTMKGECKQWRTLLFVGRVYSVKAIDRLIGGFAESLNGLKGEEVWRLRIVGPDQAGHMAELMSLCERLGLSYTDQNGKFHCSSSPTHFTFPAAALQPQVEFVGPVFGEELGAEYANCDCLALVSHTENFGATVLDAMAHGKPVITSTKTPWAEVVDWGSGWWVANDTRSLSVAIDSMLNAKPSTLCEMGKRGRALVEAKYTWRVVAEKMLDAYKQVVV